MVSGRAVRYGVGIGDRVRVAGEPHLVIGVSGTLVRLADPAGNVRSVMMTELLAGDRYELVDGPSARPAAVPGGLEGLPGGAVEQARWWEAHIAEVVYGVPPDVPPGTRPRAGFDPAVTTMTGRERAKAAELAAAGHPVTAAMVKRRRQRWEAGGLRALADQRLVRPSALFGRADPVVVEAMRAAIAEAGDSSSRTAKFIIWRAGQLLAAGHPEAVMPSRATCYRLFDTLSNGQHTTGSAATRRSLAGRPQGMFGQWEPQAPGELMQIDSTPLDVLVLLDDGVPGRVELTGMIDVATRTVTAAVLRPSARSVDAAVLLARTLTPEPMRPGWAEALSMARSVLPFERLLSIDERMAHAAARPVMVPDTIVIDHGSVFVSANFRAACRHLGISIQPAHLASGAEKPHIERAFGSIASLFCEFVSGYTGRSPDRRGRGTGDQPLWSMLELQELLDEWLIAAWQNRRHEELRDPAHPGRAFTPNEKYAALVEAAGYVPVALSGDDYIELLPAEWRAVNAYGIKIRRRTYDCEDLNPLRLQPSGVREKKDLWEVRCDPYDISKIFVRGPGGWITCRWRFLDRAPMPFGELAWDHARKNLDQAGRAATEAEIADAVAALLARAYQGPEPGTGPVSRRDRRAAARTRAVTPLPALQDPQAPSPPASSPPQQPEATGTGDEQLADVIPMPLFDPFDDSDTRW
jgi:transposase InsO family protein